MRCDIGGSRDDTSESVVSLAGRRSVQIGRVVILFATAIIRRTECVSQWRMLNARACRRFVDGPQQGRSILTILCHVHYAMKYLVTRESNDGSRAMQPTSSIH